MTDAMIPFSFIPGTKAKASEINADFDALANTIDTNKSELYKAIEDEVNKVNDSLNGLGDAKADKTDLDSKAELDLSNVDENIDFIVDSWTDGGYNWYRKFRSGYIIQGGRGSGTNGSSRALTYPTAFTTDQYSILLTTVDDTTDANYFNLAANSRSTTGCAVYLTGHGTNFSWIAMGY